MNGFNGTTSAYLTSWQANQAMERIKGAWMTYGQVHLNIFSRNQRNVIIKQTDHKGNSNKNYTQKNYHVLNTHSVNLFAFSIIDWRKNCFHDFLFKRKNVLFWNKKCRIYLRWASKKESFDIDTQNESTLKAVFNNHFTLENSFQCYVCSLVYREYLLWVVRLAIALAIKQSTIQLKTKMQICRTHFYLLCEIMWNKMIELQNCFVWNCDRCSLCFQWNVVKHICCW